VIHSCEKVELSYEIKKASRGCAPRGKENIALRTARAENLASEILFLSVFLVFDRQPRACYPKRYPKSSQENDVIDIRT